MSMSPGERSFTLWTLLEPAPSVPGQWVAICPALDLVTQGNDLEHAVEMMGEAARMFIVDELDAGRDPLELQDPATVFSRKEWAELMAVLTFGERLESPAGWQQANREGCTVAMPVQVVVDHLQAMEPRIRPSWREVRATHPPDGSHVAA